MPPVARRAKRIQRASHTIGRLFAVVGVTVLALFILLIGTITLFCYGPSPTARDLFTTTLVQSDTWAFIPRLFLPTSQVQEIVENNTVLPTVAVTDATRPFAERNKDIALDTVELLNIEGSLYAGKLLIIHDPSRLSLIAAPSFEDDDRYTIEAVMDMGNPVAAISGGTINHNGFVIQNNIIVYGSADTPFSVVAVTEANRLLVGTTTAATLLNNSIRSAVSAGPALIINGNAATIFGNGSGLSDHTVIGQRADGTLLLLVMERATHRDCAEIMLQQQAVNAAVLNSYCSAMIYNGDHIQRDTTAVFHTAFAIR